MPPLKITLDITVKCEECGTELSAEYNTRRETLTVTPCEKCVDNADSAGYSRGFTDGQGE